MYTLVLGYSATKRLSLYTGVFGDKPEGGKFANMASGGIKFLLAANWQIDISGGHSLDNRAADYYFASGLWIRLLY